MQQPIIVIFGPTASGKTAHAIACAKRVIAQGKMPVIINADSMQVYQEIPIITNQPTEAERAGIEHRLFGVMPARERCSAGQWAALAAAEIKAHAPDEAAPILVGGTGLYLKTLMEGIAPVPQVEEAIRQASMQRLKELGYDAMRAEFKQKDPLTEARLEPGNTQRLLRAWEVFEQTGIPLSEWQEKPLTPPFSPAQFTGYVVDRPREDIYQRINTRFENMIAQGVLEEVRALMQQNLDPSLPAMRAHGVPELMAHLRGEMTLEAAVEKAQQNTRNYAKRQLTWLRHQFAGFEELGIGD